MVQTVGVFEVGQIAQGLVFVGPPAVEVGFVAGAFRAADTLGRVVIDADDITLIVMVIGAEVVGVVPFSGGFGVADGLLVFCRHIFDEAVLLAGPQRTGGVARREDDRLDAFGLAVNDVGDGLHGAPRLAEEVELVEVQVFAQGDELVDPGLLGPQFGMTVEVGVAAADLVVGDDLAARVGDAV